MKLLKIAKHEFENIREAFIVFRYNKNIAGTNKIGDYRFKYIEIYINLPLGFRIDLQIKKIPYPYYK